MNDIHVPSDLWQDIRDFFLPLVAPCKDCVRGNAYSCWNSQCPAFRFRNIARRISAVKRDGYAIQKPRYVLVEDEILSALAMYDHPVPPARIVVEATQSKANKHSAVKRLIRMGRIVESFTATGSRLISLPKKRNPKNDNTEKPTSNRGADRRNTTSELREGSSDAWDDPLAI